MEKMDKKWKKWIKNGKMDKKWKNEQKMEKWKKLIDNDKLLNLYKDNFLLYKKIAKESIKEGQKENNLIIDKYTHAENMKNRVLFLIQIIPILYPNFDFFELLKEICLHEPVFQSDKLFLYDFMKKYISESNTNSNSNSEIKTSKEQKISIETQLFNMLTKENKTEMTLSQYNLFIEIFLDINCTKDLLIYNKTSNDQYDININYNVNIEDIFGIDKLWDLLFELNKEELIQKLINIIYNIYQNKDEIQKLLDKCVKIVKDIENITYNKLEKCINILKYIILNSEKEGYIKIKSHSNLLKDYLISIPLELKKNKKNNNDLTIIFSSHHANENKKNKSKGIFFGNTSLIEIQRIFAEKNNLEEKNIHINFSYKENNSLKNKTLDSSYNNKTLKEILDLNLDNYDNIDKNKNISSNKLLFIGDLIEKEAFLYFGHVNPKFENMIKQWFYIFSNGNEIMEKEQIFNFISTMTNNQNVDENNIDYINFMQEYDKEQKNFILDNEFLEYYTDLARKDSDKIKEHMIIMKYRDDFEKFFPSPDIGNVDKHKLPRYILGNDKDFHKALIDIFLKFEKKMNIYEFLFFLCTNEEEYNDLLNDFQKIYKDNNNINYLEQLYQLIILESFIQDLEIRQIDVKQIFKNNKNNSNTNKVSKENNNCEIASRKYVPFDEESNFDKKRTFLINFIENKGYEKLINYIENLLDCLNNNNSDEEKIKLKCCQIGLNIINIIYCSFTGKINNQENLSKNDIYNLNNYFDINKILSINKKEIDDNNNDDESKINKLKEIVLKTIYSDLVKKLITFLLKSQNNMNRNICNYIFNLLINIITSNELLSNEIKNNDEIRENFSTLIKNNINSPKNDDKFFINSLIKFINDLSNNKNNINKLEYQFILFIFEISNSIFKELANNNNNNNENNNNKEDKNNNSFSLFFDFFSILLKILLNNNIDNKINENLSSEAISTIYELLYKDLKEENKDKKLSEDAFLGFMKILITAIKSDKSTKNKIINKKINDETLFDIIYNKILPDNINNYRQYNNDDYQMEQLILSIEDNIEDKSKFIKIETCNELLKNFNVNDKNEEVITQKIYDIYNDFIIVCLRDTTEPEFLSKLIKIYASKKQINNSQNNNSRKKKKGKTLGYVGLKNNGCICYMNSILQQMYMVPPFRYSIMSSDDKRGKNFQKSIFNNNMYDDNLLHQLQRMYTFLTYSEKQAYNPKDFCASFKDFDGAPINPLLQQDSQEFFNNFCDKIENCLKNTKYKYIIDNIFTGKTCSSVICEKCKTVSNRFENFYNLTLEVKNISNLYESLEKLIEPEKIEQFNCEKCKEKVTISKRTSLAKLPNVLFVHLKRFYMNYEVERTEKINSKFEFPNTLNLKKFCAEEIYKNNNDGKAYETDEIYPKEEQYYEYELKGINVHLGNAQGGHYISFIDVERDGHDNELNIKNSIENNTIKSKWLKFNDSIVSEFDTKDIPGESYGGYVDNNLNNENIQNAYLLIYERKKKTPIKIVIDKENDLENKDKNLNNNVITYGKEQKANIEKFYDISNSNKELCIKEEELYKKVFNEEETKDCYIYMPYYNIDKNVLKENFIGVINKNKKFYKNKNKLEENSKFKVECNDILFGIIHLKDFNICDSRYSLYDKKQLILFFRDEIFENKIFRNNNIVTDEEQKVIINDKANIFLENLIVPIIKKEDENMTNEYEDLIEFIGNIFLSSDNMKKIFETRNMSRVFDIKNIKIMAELIYIIIKYYEKKIDIKDYFKIIYNLLEDINEDGNTYFFNNMPDGNNKKEKESPLYYLYDLINKIIHLNKKYVELLIYDQQIIKLLSNIINTKSLEIRKLLYDIISYLVDHSYQYNRNKNEGIHMINDEEERIKRQAYKDKKLIKRLFNERIDLLSKLIKMIQYNDAKYSEQFNLFIEYLFNYAIKEKKITQMLDLLYDIINIKDKYTLNRLYTIMGYPEMIIIQQIKEEDEEEEEEQNYCISSDEDEKEQRKRKKKAKNIENNENKSFLPLFGNKLFEESKNGEVFKYVNNHKIYETHCILAQLFPCSNYELYANYDFIKNESKLTEEERNKYIYKLINISLLEEGNYCLFKYIYLTQSRYIIKYNNLYEEIIDILSKENKYDLIEIKQIAEICIKRINYEKDRMNEIISNTENIHSEDFNFNNIIKNKNNESEENAENIPQLPEKMKKSIKNNKNIEEFMGFIPEHLPDNIEKVVYYPIGGKQQMIMLYVKYYTSYKDIESIRKKIKDKEKAKEEEKKEEEEEKKEEENEKKEEEKKEEENEKKEEEKKEKEEEKKEKEEEEEKKDKNEDKKDKNEIKDNKNEEDKMIIEDEEKKNINKIKDKNDDIESENEYANIKLEESEEENIYNVNRIHLSEKSFLDRAFNSLRGNNKITLFNDSFKSEKKPELTLIRYQLVTMFNYNIILRAHLKFINNFNKYICYIPDFSMGHVKSRHYTDIISVYRQKIKVNFLNKDSISVNINIKPKQMIFKENYFNEWSNSDNEFNDYDLN